MSKSSLRALALSIPLSIPLLATGGGCAGDEVGSDHGTLPEDRDKISSTAQAITKDEIMARADAYIAAKVPYCGGVRGGTDYICGGTCSRPSAPWDSYRSDCSGFVSWCWQVASDPTTSVLMSDRSGVNGWTSIGIDALEAGDALVCDGHVKLFSKKVSGSSFEIYEEYDCGKIGRKATQSFTRSGDTIHFSGDSRTYHAIRRNGLSPSIPPVIIKGYLDSANAAIDGWAVDMNSKTTALSVDVWIDGAPGKGQHLVAKADVDRPDVASSVGVDPKHGFALPTPLYFCNGKAHSIQALANPADKSAAVVLTATPSSLTCPIPAALPGVLRWITDPTALAAWKFDTVSELRWMTATDESAYEKIADLPTAPVLRRTADGAIWLIDGATRRHVTSPASFAAWAFDDKSVTAMTDAEAAAITEGLPLPNKPVLVQSDSGSKVYVLDVKTTSTTPDPVDGGPTDDAGPPFPGGDAGGGKDGGGNDLASSGDDMKGGCSASGSAPSSPFSIAWLAGSALAVTLLARRRRSDRAV